MLRSRAAASSAREACQPLEFSRYLAAERMIADAGLTQGQRVQVVTSLVHSMVSGPGGRPGLEGSGRSRDTFGLAAFCRVAAVSGAHLDHQGDAEKRTSDPISTGDPMVDAAKVDLYAMDLTDVHWVRSSYTNRWTKTCVEVADLGDGAVAVRDSNNTELPPLRFTAEEWAAFQRGVRDGEFG
ncbi:DUF397 domain-containing protein [Streptomyces sp. NPDC058451]|uniref:DUF397 domain-containing protein n=1 Tax=Streptomyces sp. NPDC058451 TaxID=3346506 RepID=UPI00364609A7